MVEKSNSSIYNEIKNMIKRDELEKIEFELEGSRAKLILYKKK
jgi:hypothetical protein